MKQSAEGNHPSAQYMLSIFYYLGKGTEKNIEEGKYWLQQSADNAYPQALYILSLENRDQENDKDAYHNFHAAAQLWHAKAQFELSAFYFNGHGVEKDPTQGIFWLKKLQNNKFWKQIIDLHLYIIMGY